MTGFLFAFILLLLFLLYNEVLDLMANLTELTAAVAESRTVVDSAIVLINGLADRLEQALTDPEALAALVLELRDQSGDLAAAVVEGTVPDEAGPAPEPEPEPEPPVE